MLLWMFWVMIVKGFTHRLNWVLCVLFGVESLPSQFQHTKYRQLFFWHLEAFLVFAGRMGYSARYRGRLYKESEGSSTTLLFKRTFPIRSVISLPLMLRSRQAPKCPTLFSVHSAWLTLGYLYILCLAAHCEIVYFSCECVYADGWWVYL